MPDRKAKEQEIWDLYRVHPNYKGALEAAGLGGPGDFDDALESDFVLIEGTDEEDDPPLRLSEYLLHTITTFAAGADL